MMKKLVGLILVLSLVLSLAGPTFAGEEDSMGLEKAITTAKKLVDVPEGYILVGNNAYEYDGTKNNKGMIWNLQWENQKEKSDINVSVDWLGNLLYYSHDVYRSQGEGLAKVSHSEALISANKFLARVMPEISGKMKPINKDETVGEYESYNFSYNLFNGNIPVEFIKASVSVNKYTGQVNFFRGLSEGQSIPKLPLEDFSGFIDEKIAKSAYLEGIGTKPVYFSNYDYKNKELKIFLAYRPNQGNEVIDAVTGKVIELYPGDFAIGLIVVVMSLQRKLGIMILPPKN